MHDLNVLFLGGSKRVSFANLLIDAGLKNKKSINIYSYELSKECPISKIASIIIGKKWSDKNILRDLTKVIEQFNIDMVIPFVDPATIISAKLKDALKDDKPEVYIPISPVDTCTIFYDKLTSSNWFKQHDIPHPQLNPVHFPKIAKPIWGSSSKGIIFLNNINDVKYYKDIIDNDEYIIEQKINGIEITVDAYISNKNQLINYSPRIREETLGGESTSTMTIDSAGIDNIINKVVSSIVFNGPITIQLIKEHLSNDLYVIEINPRLGGGVICSIHADNNIPSYLLNELDNLPLPPQQGYKKNIMMKRYFEEVIFDANNN
jgi:carbamoyl-phosphate synthase large subunit